MRPRAATQFVTLARGAKVMGSIVASGRKKTWGKHWKLHNALVRFNPAPVT